jgi:isopentenyl-diphosphate Delta-isomerase
MGIIAELEFLFKFQYESIFDNKLIENEIDYVFYGFSDELPKINTEEVNNYKYMNINDLKEDIIKNLQNYTSWL